MALVQHGMEYVAGCTCNPGSHTKRNGGARRADPSSAVVRVLEISISRPCLVLCQGHAHPHLPSSVPWPPKFEPN
eukprot:3740568-Amphidinium_carterae.1